MKEFIEYTAKCLVDNPDSVSVDSKVSEDGRTIFTLTVATPDIGKIIGKQGKTIQAMRALLLAIAGKQGVRAVLEITG